MSKGQVALLKKKTNMASPQLSQTVSLRSRLLRLKMLGGFLSQKNINKRNFRSFMGKNNGE